MKVLLQDAKREKNSNHSHVLEILDQDDIHSNLAKMILEMEVRDNPQ